jgi:hypothetical protein
MKSKAATIVLLASASTFHEKDRAHLLSPFCIDDTLGIQWYSCCQAYYYIGIGLLYTILFDIGHWSYAQYLFTHFVEAHTA